MKTLGRIIIILIAALVVAGATLAFTQSSLASSMFGRSGRAGFERRQPEGQVPAGRFPGNFEGRGRGEAFGGVNVFGIAPIVKDIAIMGAITVIVVAMTLILRAGRRSQRAHQILAAGKASHHQGLS